MAATQQKDPAQPAGSALMRICPRSGFLGFLLLAIVFASSFAEGAERRLTGSDNAEYVECARKAAELFEVPLIAVLTVLDVERGWAGAEQPNSTPDGRVVSHDLGPMQINDRAWGDTFARVGIARESLRDNACLNIHAGTWILWTHWRSIRAERAKANEPEAGALGAAVLRYHSRTPKHQARYLGLAKGALERGVKRALASSTSQELVAND